MDLGFWVGRGLTQSDTETRRLQSKEREYEGTCSSRACKPVGGLARSVRNQSKINWTIESTENNGNSVPKWRKSVSIVTKSIYTKRGIKKER